MDDVGVLEWSYRMGADEVIEEQPIDRVAQFESKEVGVKSVAPVGVVSVANVTLDTKNQASSCNSLAELEEYVKSFKGISITKTATNTVFSDGSAGAEVMLIGEAPGAEEDARGIPFCGASGQMLDQMLSYIGLLRSENFYITNTLFWRPPGNRRPTPEELAICLPFVEKHIALVKPKLIILVGGTAVASVLGSKQGITKMRGMFFDYENEFLDVPIKTTAIFHPSYLLRSPGQKSLAWKDLLVIKQYIKDNNIAL